MAINSETLEQRVSLGSVEGYIVTLDIQSFSNPESFDPTQSSGGGGKYVDVLLGVAVLGLEKGDALQAEYDHLGKEINITSNDGTAAQGDVGEVPILILGDAGA